MEAMVRVAVLGTGSLGKEHVRIYSELTAAGQVELVGIYDSFPETARKIAAKHNVRVFNSVAEAAAAASAVGSYFTSLCGSTGFGFGGLVPFIERMKLAT